MEVFVKMEGLANGPGKEETLMLGQSSDEGHERETDRKADSQWLLEMLKLTKRRKSLSLQSRRTTRRNCGLSVKDINDARGKVAWLRLIKYL